MEWNPDSSLLRYAKSLRPALEERAARCDAERTLPEETIADLRAAGLFRMMQPARYGGLECHPNEFFDVVTELAAGCPSTAWVFGVVAVHAFQLALFPEQAQEEVWGEDHDCLVSSSYMPVGKVTRVPAGYRLSGRWGFSSGADHCRWILLGAMVPPDREGKPLEMLTFLLPRADYEIVDDWHVSGLRGTGSKSVVVEDALVPDHRTHRMGDGFRCQSPGNAVNDAPLFRLPFGQVFTRTVATPSIGMLMGAIDAFVSTNKGRRGRADGKRAEEDPSGQEAIAQATLAVREVRALLHHDWDEMMKTVERREPIPIESRVAYRHHAGGVTHRMTRALDELFMETGGTAIWSDQKINRLFQDIHAARAHHANNPRKTGRTLGSLLLGHETTEVFL
jgi:3-hydroxy-9,10-secoandrosta-1,3,5(10)-triene-9,17-dione monooxygenase